MKSEFGLSLHQAVAPSRVFAEIGLAAWQVGADVAQHHPTIGAAIDTRLHGLGTAQVEQMLDRAGEQRRRRAQPVIVDDTRAIRARRGGVCAQRAEEQAR